LVNKRQFIGYKVTVAKSHSSNAPKARPALTFGLSNAPKARPALTFGLSNAPKARPALTFGSKTPTL
jgi:hypothetical protein